jgi:hypothetical protein
MEKPNKIRSLWANVTYCYLGMRGQIYPLPRQYKHKISMNEQKGINLHNDSHFILLLIAQHFVAWNILFVLTFHALLCDYELNKRPVFYVDPFLKQLTISMWILIKGGLNANLESSST